MEASASVALAGIPRPSRAPGDRAPPASAQPTDQLPHPAHLARPLLTGRADSSSPTGAGGSRRGTAPANCARWGASSWSATGASVAPPGSRGAWSGTRPRAASAREPPGRAGAGAPNRHRPTSAARWAAGSPPKRYRYRAPPRRRPPHSAVCGTARWRAAERSPGACTPRVRPPRGPPTGARRRTAAEPPPGNRPPGARPVARGPSGPGSAGVGALGRTVPRGEPADGGRAADGKAVWSKPAPAVLFPPCPGGSPGGPGRLAQWESASFTPKRSLVRTQYRPPWQAGPSVKRTGLCRLRRSRRDLQECRAELRQDSRTRPPLRNGFAARPAWSVRFTSRRTRCRIREVRRDRCQMSV